MTASAKIFLLPLLALSLLIPPAFADNDSPPGQSEASSGRVYTQAELDQMLAPIALYPDSMLSQILMASTYPLEIVEAARWSKNNPGMSGEQAVRAVDDRNWDPSVKSLVAFPQLLATMDEKLDWTEQMGDAFLGQQSQVMDTVQGLRKRAYDSGNLRSDDRMRVENQGGTIAVEPTSPQVVYVPYYDPGVVYGPWWWAAYPPVFWHPWAGYYVGPGVRFAWGAGFVVGAGFFFSSWNWHQHVAFIVPTPPFYYRRPVVVVRSVPGNYWYHDPYHRRGVPYRSPVVRERYAHNNPSPDWRRNYRGYVPTPVNRHDPDNRGGNPNYNNPGYRNPPDNRGGNPYPGNPGSPGHTPDHRGGTPPVAGQPGGQPGGNPPHSNPPYGNPPGNQPGKPVSNAPKMIKHPENSDRMHAFEGVGQGQEVRSYSDRGHSSSQGQSSNASSGNSSSGGGSWSGGFRR